MANSRSKDVRNAQPVDEEKLHQKIGQQAIEIDFLKKSCVNWVFSTSRNGGN